MSINDIGKKAIQSYTSEEEVKVVSDLLIDIVENAAKKAYDDFNDEVVTHEFAKAALCQIISQVTKDIGYHDIYYSMKNWTI